MKHKKSRRNSHESLVELNMLNLELDKSEVLSFAGKLPRLTSEEIIDFKLIKNENCLMNRIEDKFFLPASELQDFCSLIREKLKEGDIDTSVRYNTNRTIYLDSLDLDSFRDNIENIRPRFKVRIRQYKPNDENWEDIAFLELKIKNEDGMSNKVRIRIHESMIEAICRGEEIENSKELELLNKDIPKAELWRRIVNINTVVQKYGFKKQVIVEYHRRAYSNNEIRISIDDSLRYYDFRPLGENSNRSILNSEKWKKINKTFKKINAKDFLILEIKHENKIPDWLKDVIKKMKIKEVGFSKYCASIISHLTNGYKNEGDIQKRSIRSTANKAVVDDLIIKVDDPSFAFADDIEKSIGRITVPKEKGISSRPDQQVYRTSMWSGRTIAKPDDTTEKDFISEKIKSSHLKDKYQSYSPFQAEVSSNRLKTSLTGQGKGARGLFVPTKNNQHFAIARGDEGEEATAEHEGFHLLSQQILDKHGEEAHSDFLINLIDVIHPSVLNLAHNNLQANLNYRSMFLSDKQKYRSAYLEEIVNLVRDLNVNPNYRSQIKRMHNVDEKGKSLTGNIEDEGKYRNFDALLKTSWKNIMNRAKKHKFNLPPKQQEMDLAASELIDGDLTKGSFQKRNKSGVSPEEFENTKKWINATTTYLSTPSDKARQARESLQQPKKMLNRLKQKLGKETLLRKHPETGEIVALLHRGMSHEEHDTCKKDLNINHDRATSWTTDKNVADKFKPVGGNTVSAWVPLSKITSAPFLIPDPKIKSTGDHDALFDLAPRSEREIIVGPDHNSMITNANFEPKKDTIGEKIRAYKDNRWNRMMIQKIADKKNKLAASEVINNDIKKGSLQRKMPFNPMTPENQRVKDEQRLWTHDEMDEMRNSLPEMKGNARTRALRKLASQTHVRKHPETGERMYLMHRGMGHKEFTEANKNGKTTHEEGARTSWTPRKEVGIDFAAGKQRLVSAWIPESALIHSINQFNTPSKINVVARKQGEKRGNDRSVTEREEQEWIVEHGTEGFHHANLDTLTPSPSDTKINTRKGKSGDKASYKAKDLKQIQQRDTHKGQYAWMPKEKLAASEDINSDLSKSQKKMEK